MAAGAEGRQASRGQGDGGDLPARRVPGRGEEPEGLQPGRLPGSPIRLHGARAAGRQGVPHPGGPRAGPAGRLGRPCGLQPGALPRDPLRKVLRDRDPGRHLPAPGQRAGRARREGGVPDRTPGQRKAPRHRSRVRPSEDGHRGREGRRARARGRPRPAQQRLVRRALARPCWSHDGRRGVAGDAPRGPRLHRGPHRPGLAGRVPPEAAEVGDRGDRPTRHSPSAGGRLANHRDRSPREGDRDPSAGLGPLPPLRLPAARLHVGRDAGPVRGELRRRAIQPVPDRRGRLPAPRLAADRRVLPARSRCATCG